MIYPHRKLIKPPLGSRPYKGHKLSRGLVGYWLMNEGSGNKVFGLSGNGNIGSLGGDTHWIPGKFGYALDFDGDEDYVSITDKPVFDFSSTSQKFTLLAGISPSAINAQYGIFTKYQTDGTKEWLFLITSANKLRMITYENSISGDYSGLRHLSDNAEITVAGQFYLISAVVDVGANNIDLYVNGKEVPSTAETGKTSITDITNTPADIFIGMQELGNLYSFNGTIEFAMIYNRALSASEIALLYREPFCMFKDPNEMAVLGGYTAVGTTRPLVYGTLADGALLGRALVA